MRLLLPLAGLLILVLPNLADAAAPLTLAEAEAIAIERDAVRAQLAAQVDALSERAVATGALPDPEVTLGMQNLPAGSFALDADPMTMTMLGVEQMIPSGKRREFERARGSHLADAMHIGIEARERQLRFALRRAWLGVQTAAAQEALAQAVRAEVDTLSSAAAGRYATGGGNQSDFLAAQLRLDRLEVRALQAHEQWQESLALLRRWLGEIPRDLATIRFSEPLPRDELQSRLTSHPLIKSNEARIHAGEAAESAAEASFWPNWKVGVSYGHRRGIDMSGEPADDMVSLMVGMNLPLFTRNRQGRELSAARSETRAARHEREDVLRELHARFDSAWQRHQEAARQLALYEQRLLPASRRVVEATREAYAANNAGFDALVEAQTEHYEIETRRLELVERLQLARAEIRYLTGEPQ